MVQLLRWFERIRVRWDHGVMKRKGAWGDNEATVEYLLDLLTTERLRQIDLPSLKQTEITSRSPRADIMVQIIQRARWTLHEMETVVKEEVFLYDLQPRSLDEYLVTVTDVPIRAEDAVARLKVDLLPMMELLLLMEADNHPNANYYRRQYEWLFIEVREFLEALVRASDPALTF